MAKGTKTGGRMKGTPNKLTKEMRIVLKNAIANELENLEGYFKELEPAERINLLLKLMPYVMPKVKDISHERGEPINFDIGLI